MKLRDIIYNQEKLQKLYFEYIKFEKNRSLKKIPWKILMICILCVIVLSLFIQSIYLFIIGFLMILVSFLYYLFIVLLFHNFKMKYKKWLYELSLNENNDFQFGLDEHGITKITNDINQTISWNIICHCIQNDKVLYLYNKDKYLNDIFILDQMPELEIEVLKKILPSKFGDNFDFTFLDK